MAEARQNISGWQGPPLRVSKNVATLVCLQKCKVALSSKCIQDVSTSLHVLLTPNPSQHDGSWTPAVASLLVFLHPLMSLPKAAQIIFLQCKSFKMLKSLPCLLVSHRIKSSSLGWPPRSQETGWPSLHILRAVAFSSSVDAPSFFLLYGLCTRYLICLECFSTRILHVKNLHFIGASAYK